MVWIEEIGDALIGTTITATRLDGSTFEVTPEWEAPEGENKEDAYSSNPKIVFAFERQQLNLQNQKEQRLLKETEDTDGDGEVDTANVRGTPIPYILFFRIELITYWKEDDLALLLAWLKKFPARGHIDVTDPSDNEVYRLFMEQVDHAPIEEEDRNAQSGRMYRQFFRYAIWTELDSSQSQTYKLVKERIVTVNKKE